MITSEERLLLRPWRKLLKKPFTSSFDGLPLSRGSIFADVPLERGTLNSLSVQPGEAIKTKGALINNQVPMKSEVAMLVII